MRVSELNSSTPPTHGVAAGAEHSSPSRLLSGEILQIRQGLQACGFFDSMRRVTWRVLSDHLSASALQYVQREGFHLLHEVTPVASLPDIIDSLCKEMSLLSLPFLKAFARTSLGLEHSLFLEAQPNARILFPVDSLRRNSPLLTDFLTRKGPGKLTEHGPHQDSWYAHPTNAINVWCALSSVTVGNGLCIWPSYWPGRPANEKRSLADSLSFALDPGDVLVFHGEHYHASELNWTDRTRYVVSLRLCFDRPKFQSGHVMNPYHLSTLVGTPWQRLSWLPVYMNKRYLRYAAKDTWRKWCGKESYRAAAFRTYRSERSFHEIRSQRVAAQIAPPPHDLTTATDQKTLLVPSASLSENQILPLDPHRVIYRSQGEPAVASRFCPHEGADLAGASLAGGKIVCPWHRLVFDASTGLSPCRTIPPLKRFACRERLGTIEVASEAGLD